MSISYFISIFVFLIFTWFQFTYPSPNTFPNKPSPNSNRVAPTVCSLRGYENMGADCSRSKMEKWEDFCSIPIVVAIIAVR
jgi:hypothetical protein